MDDGMSDSPLMKFKKLMGPHESHGLTHLSSDTIRSMRVSCQQNPIYA
jgi:hypothetical protein